MKYTLFMLTAIGTIRISNPIRKAKHLFSVVLMVAALSSCGVGNDFAKRKYLNIEPGRSGSIPVQVDINVFEHAVIKVNDETEPLLMAEEVALITGTSGMDTNAVK